MEVIAGDTFVETMEITLYLLGKRELLYVMVPCSPIIRSILPVVFYSAALLY